MADKRTERVEESHLTGQSVWLGVFRRDLRGVAAAAALCAVAGCTPHKQGFIERLPDPVVHTSVLGQPVTSEPPLARPGQILVSPEPSWMPAGGIDGRWRCIVIHHSANGTDTPKGIDEYHRRRGWDEMGYHFVIGNGVNWPDGKVFVGPRWSKQKHGAHCKTPGNYYNDHGIGICLVGNLEHTHPTHAQMESLAALCRFLCMCCDIPESQILTHGGITGRTACPGRHFSLAQLHRLLDQTVMTASSQ
jgi:hypothetical protein